MFMIILSLVVGGIFFALKKKLLGPAAKLCVFAVLIIIAASNPIGAAFLGSCLLLVIGGCIVSSLVRVFRYGKRASTAYTERNTKGSLSVIRVVCFGIWYLFKGIGLVCWFLFKVLLSVVLFVTNRW